MRLVINKKLFLLFISFLVLIFITAILFTSNVSAGWECSGIQCIGGRNTCGFDTGDKFPDCENLVCGGDHPWCVGQCCRWVNDPPPPVCTPWERNDGCTGNCGGCSYPNGEYQYQYCVSDGSGWSEPTYDCQSSCGGYCPLPDCDSGISCNGSCWGASSNTCYNNNASKAGCEYTSHSSGAACNRAWAPDQACTQDNCSSGYYCSSGSCVQSCSRTPGSYAYSLCSSCRYSTNYYYNCDGTTYPSGGQDDSACDLPQLCTAPPPGCDFIQQYNQCGANAGACANNPGAIDYSHTVEVRQYQCKYDCTDLGQRAGECGNTTCDSRQGTECGTYGCCSSSNVESECYKTYDCQGNCVYAGIRKVGEFCGNGICTCNEQQTCSTDCGGSVTPKYRCSGSSCVRDDAGGTYTTSNCNNNCTGTSQGGSKTYVSPNSAKVGDTVTVTATGDYSCSTYIDQRVGGGLNSCSGSGYRCDGNPMGDGKPCWWRETCRASNTGNFTASFNASGSNCYSSQSYTINPNCTPQNGGWSGWGNCSNTCGSGTQTRTCTQPPPSCNGSGCSGSSTQSCTNYSGCTYTWKTSSWGGCSNSCGAGTQSRSVWCERPDGSQVADSYCGGGKPATSQSCTSYSTCTYSWQAGSWGACSVTCGGGGTRVRDVWCRRIQTDERVADSYCGGGRPNANEPCNQFPCVPTGLIGECGVPGTSATLNWNAASGATYYEVRVNGQTINTNSSGPLTVNNMIAGQNNEWLVRGCSASVCGGSAVGNVYCTPVSRNAQFISRTCPFSFMVPGQTANVAVTMKNTGNYRWSPTEMYRLGSQNPANNEVWGFRRVDLGSTVAPGSEYAFNFTATAPNAQGKQSFQWQMLQEDVEWFGQISTECPDIIVSPQCPGGRGACGDYVPSPWTIGSCSGGTWVASHGTDNGYDKWCQNYVNPTRGYCYRCDKSFSPWIQAVGDVHSNERINASGGP